MTERRKAARPIRRLSPLCAVWLTYWSRPLFWIFLIVLLLFAPAAWLTWMPTHMPAPTGLPPSRDMASALPRIPNPAPHASVFLKDDGEVQDKEPDWSKLRSFTLYRGLASCRPLWTPGAMPLLESITIFESMQDDQIRTLCELYDLKSLALNSASDLTDVSMKRLAAETRLEFLSLNLSGRPSFDIVRRGMRPEDLQQRAEKKTRILQNAELLVWPASLKTLIFDATAGTSLARLKEWQRLPQLRVLATRLTPAEGSRLSDETLEILRSFPRLRKLYLHEYPAAAELSVVQQRLLPGIQVRPFLYDPVRGLRASVVMLFGMIVTLLLALQMSAQFVTPTSLLTPRYARTHVGFAAIVATLMVVGSFIVLLLTESSMIAALGLCGGSITLLAVGARLMRSLSTFPLPGFANFGFTIACAVFPVMGMQFVIGFYGAEVDWFLRGQHPWFAIALFAVAIWGAIDLVTWHIALPRLLEEGGCANVPLGMFDAAGWMEWGRSLTAIREAQGKRSSYSLRSRDADLDRFVQELREHRGTSLLALWRLGNVQSTMRCMLFFVVTFIPLAMLGAAAIKLGSLDLSLAENGWKFLWPMMGQALFMLLLFPFMFAWQRRSMIPLELLRPVDRRDWIRTWFQGIAGELIPLLLVVAVLAVLAWSFGHLKDWTLPQLVLSGIGFLATVTLMAAIGLWLLTTTSIWWVVLTSILLWFVAVAVMMLPMLMTGSQTPFDAGLMAQVFSVAIVCALSIAALRFAWWRWQCWEVGRIS